MRRICKFISTVMAITLFITGCGCSNGALVVEKEAKRREATGEKWTVLIYMCGGDLEEAHGRAGEVLSNLSYDLPENINVVVETGGCRNWSTEEIRNDRIEDFAVQKNGLKLINEGLIKNMGESESYKDFLARNIEKFPADNYISVIWGNGGGPVVGATMDATHNYDPLTVTEIAEAHAMVGTRFDIIGFDASLMSNLETAAALSIFCDYLVAAEDIMPISGWDYRGLFDFISNNPQATAVEVGEVICDGVVNNAQGSSDITAVMAVTDLSRVTRMVQSFDSMAYAMATTTEDVNKLKTLKNSIHNVQALGVNSEAEGYSNLVDMVSLAKCVFDATADDSARIENVLTKTVVYKRAVNKANEMCGLGVYYPISPSADSISKYRSICPSMGYMEYIDKTDTNELVLDKSVDIKETGAWNYYNTYAPYNSISAFYDPTGVYTLNVVSPELISAAGVNIYKYDEESGKYMYLLSDYNTENIGVTYSYEFENKIFELNGTPVSANLISRSDTWEIYGIPVLYKDEISSIRVMKTFDDDGNSDYKVLGMWQGTTKDGVLERKFKNLSAGDVIIPVYKAFSTDHDEYVEGKSLKLVFGGVNIKEKAIPDGDYMISYTVRDIYGREVESNTTNVSALKGKLKTSN